MENPSGFTRPDLINLVLILLIGLFLAVHTWKSQANTTIIANQEAAHISTVSGQLKALKAQVQELKDKSAKQ